jgi:hypothetical protein
MMVACPEASGCPKSHACSQLQPHTHACRLLMLMLPLRWAANCLSCPSCACCCHSLMCHEAGLVQGGLAVGQHDVTIQQVPVRIISTTQKQAQQVLGRCSS